MGVVFTYSINQACEIRKCHVAVMQQQLSNVQKSVIFFLFDVTAYLFLIIIINHTVISYRKYIIRE